MYEKSQEGEGLEIYHKTEKLDLIVSTKKGDLFCGKHFDIRS